MRQPAATDSAGEGQWQRGQTSKAEASSQFFWSITFVSLELLHTDGERLHNVVDNGNLSFGNKQHCDDIHVAKCLVGNERWIGSGQRREGPSHHAGCGIIPHL